MSRVCAQGSSLSVAPSVSNGRKRRSPYVLRLEPLEDRTLPSVTAAPMIVPPLNGVPGQKQTVAFFASDASSDPSAEFTFSIDWGDGLDTLRRGTSGLKLEHVYRRVGEYTISAAVLEEGNEPGPSATAAMSIVPVALQSDPATPGGTLLAVGGTLAAERISVEVSPAINSYAVEINHSYSWRDGPLSLTKVLVFGQGGNDLIQINDGGGRVPAVVYAGPGDDTVTGGAGDDVLIGDEGDDWLNGGEGRNLLIGRNGADRLQGGSDDDILITGTSTFNDDLGEIAAIMREWTSGRDRVTRERNLRDGSGSADRENGDNFLQQDVTVFNDEDADALKASAGVDWLFFDAARDIVSTLLDPPDSSVPPTSPVPGV